jgi:hypothetical protein
MRRVTITTLDADLEEITSGAWITSRWDAVSDRAFVEVIQAHDRVLRLWATFDAYAGRTVFRPRYSVMPAFVDVQVDTYLPGGNQVDVTATATFEMRPIGDGSFAARKVA